MVKIIFALLLLSIPLYCNEGRSFDGSSYMETESFAFNSVGTFTLMGWYKTTNNQSASNGGQGMLFGTYYPSWTIGWNFRIISGNLNIQFPEGGSTVQTTVTNATLGNKLIDGNWHHLAITQQDRIGWNFFFDGVLIKSSGDVITSAVAAVPFNIGMLGDHSTYNYNGSIDEIRIFNVYMSTAQINDEMNNSRPGESAGMELNLRMEETAGAPKDYTKKHQVKLVTGTATTKGAPIKEVFFQGD